MSTNQDQPTPAGRPEIRPVSPPPPPGWDDEPARSHKRRRFSRGAVAAAAAFVLAGSGTAWGLSASGAMASASTPLTTSQIAARTSPGLVDIVSTLGYQNAAAAGTGLVLTSSGEVLTNDHVIDGATSIKVTDVGNGRTYAA